MDEVVQYVIHPALRPTVDQWLATLGYEVVKVETSDDDLPTFVISPTTELLERSTRT